MTFDLKGQKSFFNEVDNKTLQKKVDTDIYKGSRVIRSQRFQFDLRGQVDLEGLDHLDVSYNSLNLISPELLTE